MDSATLAGAVVGLLVPLLQGVGQQVLDQSSQQLADTALDKARALYQVVKAHLVSDPYTATLLAGLKDEPGNQLRQRTLETALAELIERDPAFAATLRPLVAEAQTVGPPTHIQATNAGITAGGSVSIDARGNVTGRDAMSSSDSRAGHSVGPQSEPRGDSPQPPDPIVARQRRKRAAARLGIAAGLLAGVAAVLTASAELSNVVQAPTWVSVALWVLAGLVGGTAAIVLARAPKEREEKEDDPMPASRQVHARDAGMTAGGGITVQAGGDVVGRDAERDGGLPDDGNQSDRK